MADLTLRDGQVTLIDDNGNTIYSFPDSDGIPGQSLVTDGSGKLTFGAGSGIQIKQSDGTIVAILSGKIL